MSVLESINSDASYSAGLWCTRNSIDSLETANLSFHAASVPQVHGLEDVVRTVQRLNVRRFPYDQIQHGERIGEGETFWVEKCFTNGKAVAVKHLKVGSREAGSLDFLQRVNSLLLELRIMHHGPLRDHPNILSLVGYGWNTGGGSILPYILVDFCADGNLRQYLHQRDVSPIHKESLIANVATGIHALHLAGVIHGDVKLDNVLVDDTRSAPIAKICDFGHSIVMGLDSDIHRAVLFRGTNRYNPPEVFRQAEQRIPRTQLTRCDIWAFGLLAWEVLLDGNYYTSCLTGMTDDYCAGNPPDDIEPDTILASALSAARTGTDDIQRAIYRKLFRSTLVTNPDERAGQLDSLIIMSKWSKTTAGLNIAQLASHTDASKWSYEIFHHENDREIFWVHKEHIFRDLTRIVHDTAESDALKGTAAWQAAICLTTGFGVSINVSEADLYFSRAAEFGVDIAETFGPLVIRSGIDHDGRTYTEAILSLLSSKYLQISNSQTTRQPRARNTVCITSSLYEQPSKDAPGVDPKLGMPNKSASTLEYHLSSGHLMTTDLMSLWIEAIQQKDCARIHDLHKTHPLQRLLTDWSGEPVLILGLQTRDAKTVTTLIECGASPETRGAGGRNSFHWLFMLDHDALTVASESFIAYQNSASLNTIALGTVEVFPQWPLALRGTPLAHAISVGSYHTVKALLCLGANPTTAVHAPMTTAVASRAKWTPIHIAIKYHRPDILGLLLHTAGYMGRQYRSSLRLNLRAIALCGSTDLELIAMHGRGREANLRDTVVLLGSLDLLGEHLAFEDGPNAIMVSLERHNFRVLKALLQQNASLASAPSISPNRVEADTFHYPIHHAAYVASRRDDPAALEALEVILNYSPQALSSHDSLGRTPLHIAASGSSPLTALFILDRLPVLLKSKDNYGAEPLHYCESATVCEQLLLRGANANAMDFATKTALCNAVTKGLESVVNMLCKNGAITDLPNSSIYNPLHIAIKRTFHTIASMLIGYGSSPNIVDEQGDSPVHIAAAGSPRHILRMLLASGADPFVLNKKHQSALATAVEHNNTAAVEELSRHSPGLILRPLNIAGTSQGTCSSPLFCIQEHNTMREMMRLLTVTEFEVLDSAGLNVLHSAVLTGNLLLVSALIEKGVNLEIQDHQGNTALMLAIRRPAASKRRSHLDIFKKLADHGASMITKNYAGETAWDIATTEIEDDSYVILTALLKHSKEACGDVSQGSQVKSRVYPAWFGQRQIKQTCGSTLVQLAIHRPDQKLLAALRLRMPALEFKAAENMVRAALPDPLRHYRDAYNSNPSLPFVPGAVPDGLYRTATIPTKPPCDLTVTLNSRVEPVELEDTSFLFLARARSSEQAFIASYPDGPFELSTSKYY